MGKRTTEPMTPGAPADKTAAIRSDIAQTRGDMSRTINQIEERLSPAHLKEQIADIKQSAIGQYHDAKDHVKDDLARELESAKAKVQEEVAAAKLAVQRELHEARMAVREATVGKVEHMVQDARDAVNDAGSSVLDTIKENPIPSAMLAIGLGWLIFGGKKTTTRGPRGAMRNARAYDDGYGYRGYDDGYDASMVTRGRRALGSAVRTASDGVSTAAHRVQDGASHLVDQASTTAHDVGESAAMLAHRATEGANHLAHDARDGAARLARAAGRTGRRAMRTASDGAHRVEEGFEATMRDNPLAVGAVVVAIGAAVGLALPHTEKEDEWMGSAKDRLVDRAQGIAHETLQKVEEQVGDLAGKAEAKVKQVATSTSNGGHGNNGNNGSRDSSAHLA